MDGYTRGFRIIESFRPMNPWLSISEIANATAMPRSTVGRLVATLVGAGYIETSSPPGKLRLSERAALLVLREMPVTDVMLLVRDWAQSVVEPTTAVLRVHRYENGVTEVLAELRSMTQVPVMIPGATSNSGVEAAVHATLEASKYGTEGNESRGGTPVGEELGYKGFAITLGYEGIQELNAVTVTMHLRGAGQIYVFELVGPADELPTRVLNFELGPALASVKKRIAAEFERGLLWNDA